jgi:glyoxalase family protein
MDHKFITKIGNRFRYSSDDKPGNIVDILCSPETVKGLSGYSTVHHVAFATETEITQLAARERLLEFGLDVTPVLNREYFLSIYFREPGGVLFEIATVSPGFSIDEPFEHLGEAFKLPPWEEQNRASIEQRLPPIRLKF